MRLVTYESNGKWQAGIVIKDKVVDSVAAAKAVNIIADVKPTMRIFSDQTFGPVVPIVVVNDEPQCRSVASKAVVTGALVGKLHLMTSRSCAGSASNRPSEHFHK